MKSKKKQRDLDNIQLAIKQHMKIALGVGILMLFAGFYISNFFMKLLGVVAFAMVLLLYYNRLVVQSIKEALN